MEKLAKAAMLLDYYGALLSQRQREVLSMRYEDDMTFSEIAEQLRITRQGAQDIERRSLSKLEEFENRLHYVRRHERLRDRLGKIASLAADMPESPPRNQIIKLVELSDEELFGKEEENGV